MTEFKVPSVSENFKPNDPISSAREIRRMNSKSSLKSPSSIGKRTVFLTALRVIDTSPHHLNPSIVLNRNRELLRVIAPADAPGEFEPSSLLKSYFKSGTLQLIPRGRTLLQRLIWHARAWKAVRRNAQEIDAQELYVYGPQSALVALFLLPFFKKGKRVVYHTQDFLEPWRHPFRALLEAIVCRRAAYVIVNEINRGRVLQSLYLLSAPPIVVPTGILSDWPVPESSSNYRNRLLNLLGIELPEVEKPILIVHQGPLRVNRCGKELIEAISRLPERFWLVVTGMEPMELENMARSVSRAPFERIRTLGLMEFQDMLEVTANCDIGVLLYPNDGIGNFYQAPGRLSENCRAGIPSIASDFPSFQNISNRNIFLSLCDPSSPNDIARAILRLGGLEPRQKRHVSATARHYALESLAFDTTMEIALTEIDNG